MLPQQIQDYIEKRKLEISPDTRELTSRETNENATLTREVYKEKKIKREKESSRGDHEERGSFLPSAPVGQEQPVASLQGEGPMDSGNESATHENFTSRAYTGISVYHNITSKGIKLNITLQTPEDAEFGACLEITAELKQKSRFYEIKDYDGDDEEYKEFVRELIDHYRKDPDQWAIGRVHERGKRDKWYGNTIVVGKLDDGIVTDAILFLECERYDVGLNLALNPNQLKYYHTGGLFGNLRSIKAVPRLATAERKRFNP